MKLKLWNICNPTGWVKDVFENIDYLSCDNIEDADYILVPDVFTSNVHKKNLEWLQKIYLYSIKNRKPYIAFLHDDPTESMDGYTDNGILFRTSYYKSKSENTEYALPSFSMGIDCQMNPITENKIIIGFCAARTHRLRHDSMYELNNCPYITTRFIIRKKFHGHFTIKEQEINKKEFKNNMSECSYQLCVRGSGNFSHRFYEAMMYGRIPVLVDSDIPLPCSELIDWEKHIVISKTSKGLPNKLIEFHNTHDIVESQKKCRDIWEQHLSAIGFSSYVEYILLKHKTIFKYGTNRPFQSIYG